MKTIKYMCLLALTAGFTACSQYEEPNPAIPVTPQGQEFLPGTNGIEITPSSFVSPAETTEDIKTIDLVTYSKIGFDIQTANISLKDSQVPAGYNLSYEMYVSDDASFKTSYLVPITVSGNVITVTPEALQEVHDKIASPVVADPMQLWARYAVYASNEEVSGLRIGSSDTWFGQSTFIITPSPAKIPCLYTPGASNSWNQEASQKLGTTDYTIYSGFAHLSGEFKFSSQPNWNGINFGAGTEPLTLSIAGDAGNLSVPNDGLYYLKNVNVTALTYEEPIEITSIGLIGSATPKGWDGQTNLTPSDDFLTWTGTVTLTAGEFKFRCNDDWGIAMGVDLNNLDMSGGAANISWGEAGTFEVTLDLSSIPYKATLVKK